MTPENASSDDEFEIIPTSPIRRLEKRMEKMEGGSYSSEVSRLIEQVLDLIKSNQKIIDSSIKANNELIAEVSRLPKKMDDLMLDIREFMKLLKISAEEEEVSSVSKEVMAPLVDKLAEIIEQNKKNFETNQAALTTLGMIEKRLKRFYAPPPSPMGPVRSASEYRTEMR